MKLYYTPGACSLVIRILLHEMTANADFEAVDLATKKTETGKDFFAINQKGAVPTLVLDNEEVLTENAMIQQYLADHYKATNLLPPIGDLKRYRVLEWLNYIATELHKGLSPFFNPHIPKDIKENVFAAALKNKLTYLSQRLGKQNYLMGDEFTLPDAYAFYALNSMPVAGIHIKNWPNLVAYFDRIKQRKSVQQAMQEEKLLS
ncbi:MAG: glutathione transferase GstA [Proteobacteria bacterium]|nr:glutathione transferase GstA [Pseudomonadota bacterium]